MSYTKLFGSILLSTVWELGPEERIVWITMLALCDRDGIVSASVPGLAHAARVDVSKVESALAVFLAPCPYSSTPDHDGTRLRAIEGGWQLTPMALRERQIVEAEDELMARRLRSVSRTLRNAVVERDGYRCHICTEAVDPDDIHIDHVIPFVKGGPTTLENLRVAHSVCNLRKGGR
jgi:hypothetical protein